jgi:hypothetical protein
MKTLLLLFVMGAALFLTACGTPANDSHAAHQKQIDSLTNRIAELEKQNSQVMMKGRIAGSFSSGLDAFFEADEFWEDVVDVGDAECSKRCIEMLQTHRKACAEMTDCAAREACYKEATTNAANCHKQCMAN